MMSNFPIYINMYNAKAINNRARWFRSIKPGDVSEGFFKNSKTFDSISVQLTQYNRTLGKEKGVFIHAKYYPDNASIILVGVTLKERERELVDKEYSSHWRKLIIKEKYGINRRYQG